MRSIRFLFPGLVALCLCIIAVGCRTTVETYTPPAPSTPAVPVDPHRTWE